MPENRSFSTALLTPRGITWSSVLINIVLSAAKVAAGFLFRSQAILADGLHSSSDLITDIAVLAGLRVSQRPADLTHHYGHRRVSTLVAMFVGAALAGAAAWIAVQAVQTIHNYLHGHAADSIRPGLPFWLAIASAPVKEAVFRLTRYVGRKNRDLSLVANAWHHRADALAAVATAAGLGGVLIGGSDYRYLDPLTALVLAAFLVVVAWRIVTTSASELIDRAPHNRVLAGIERAVAGTPGVKSFHAFRARQVGGKVTMDVHVQVDGGLTVRQGHDIASAVRGNVFASAGDVIEVIVHVEPKEDSPDAQAGATNDE